MLSTSCSNTASLACTLSTVEKRIGFLLILSMLGGCFLTSPRIWASTEINSEAESLMKQKKWAEAAVALKTQAKESPGSLDISLNLAKALVYSGRREEALSLLLRVADQEKGNTRQALIRRARVLSKLFLTSQSQQAYQEAWGLILNKKTKNAREALEKVLEQEPQNVEVLTRLGQCYVLEGEFDSGAERLRAAKSVNPYEPEIRLWLGRALHQRGELTQAVEELKFAKESLAGSEIATVWLAEAIDSQGLRNAALLTLTDFVRTQPLQLPALVALARMKMQSSTNNRDYKQLWEARKDLQLALSRFESYSGLQNTQFEGDLGISLRDPGALKTQIDALIDRIEKQLHQDRENEPNNLKTNAS